MEMNICPEAESLLGDHMIIHYFTCKSGSFPFGFVRSSDF